MWKWILLLMLKWFRRKSLRYWVWPSHTIYSTWALTLKASAYDPWVGIVCIAHFSKYTHCCVSVDTNISWRFTHILATVFITIKNMHSVIMSQKSWTFIRNVNIPWDINTFIKGFWLNRHCTSTFPLIDFHPSSCYV